MNLYRIERHDGVHYDEYGAAVVAAEDEDDARTIHPGGDLYGDWDGTMAGGWVAEKNVRVELIGKAAAGVERGVVVASFKAG